MLLYIMNIVFWFSIKKDGGLMGHLARKQNLMF